MKKSYTAVAAALFLLLTGCSFTSGIDTLILPPKLSQQQEHIYNALKTYAGTNISLKYPKSGDYLSAFIIADIDGDDNDEAIVFYEKNTVSAEENSLRMNILDCIDSKWQSVYDHAADGNEVEKVVITPLGDNDRINIIVGYSLINKSEKVVSIYHYDKGTLNTTFENNYYSLFDAADLNGDETKELFIALNQTTSREASAEIYHLKENGEYFKSSVDFPDESYSDYQKISYAKEMTNDKEKTYIYLDAVVGSGTIVTPVLTVDENDILAKVFTPDASKEQTLRSSAYTCIDVDDDGKIEIPVLQPFPGYKDTDESNIYMTKWHELKGDKLSVKMCGYHSITNGFSFVFPDGWLGNVTAISDSSHSFITFCHADGEKILEDKPLFTVYIVSLNDTEKMNELMNSGCDILHSRSDKLFMIDINEEDGMTKPSEELMLRFKFYD